MKTVSENASFGGVQGVYSHASDVCGCEMTFAVYLPPQAKAGKVPVLWYLSGLTCTHENAMTKAGAQGWAAEEGIAVDLSRHLAARARRSPTTRPTTSGRGRGSTSTPPRRPGRRTSACGTTSSTSCPTSSSTSCRSTAERQGITGHSMGGHGALTIAMTRPETYRSLSAISPIANPTRSDWGRKQFAAYLGGDESAWAAHDATLLMREKGFPRARPGRPGGEGPVPRPAEARGAGRGRRGAAPADASSA